MPSKKSTKHPSPRTNILLKATPLFAAQGYSGVSMRDISKQVGTSAAALYHHFPDKQSLYMAVMEHVFSDKMAAMVTALDTDAPPLERFEQFIRRFVELMGNDNSLRVLLQRELLDGDEVRLKFLAERLFVAPFEAVTSLAKSVSSKTDPYMLAISVVGLVLFHFETATLRNFLPGGDDKRNHYDNITEHVTQLLQMALGKGTAQ